MLFSVQQRGPGVPIGENPDSQLKITCCMRNGQVGSGAGLNCGEEKGCFVDLVSEWKGARLTRGRKAGRDRKASRVACNMRHVPWRAEPDGKRDRVPGVAGHG